MDLRYSDDNLKTRGLMNQVHIADIHFGAMKPQKQYEILKEQFLCLDVPLNTCKDVGNYSLQNLDNKFNELLTNCIEYFSEIKENNTLYEQLDKFFNVTNNNNICI